MKNASSLAILTLVAALQACPALSAVNQDGLLFASEKEDNKDGLLFASEKEDNKDGLLFANKETANNSNLIFGNGVSTDLLPDYIDCSVFNSENGQRIAIETLGQQTIFNNQVDIRYADAGLYSISFNNRTVEVITPGLSMFQISYSNSFVSLQCSYKDATNKTAAKSQHAKCKFMGENVSLGKAVEVNGHTAKVEWLGGFGGEQQELLWMRLDGLEFKSYDPAQSTYSIGVAGNSVQLTCGF